MSNSGQSVVFPSPHPQGDGRGVVFGDSSRHGGGLIVIHEWWGLTRHIQYRAASIATDGEFTVLVVDFYRGKVAKDFEEAGHLMNNLDWPGALHDISAAAKYLQGRGCSKVGVTGFCMGGALSFAAAAKCPEVSAAAPFYGIPKPDVADLTQITVPLQAHFGEHDQVVGFSSPEDYQPLRERLEKAGVRLEFYTYDAGHAFTNSEGPNYNPDASRLALGRLCSFMRRHLHPTGNQGNL